MPTRFTIYMTHDQSRRPIHLSISRGTVLAATGFLFILFSAVGLLFSEYIHLRLRTALNQELSATILAKEIEIERQRGVIRSYTDEIDAIKTRLAEFKAFEEMARVLGNVSPPAADDPGMNRNTILAIAADFDITEDHLALIRDMYAQFDRLEFASQVQEQAFNAILTYFKDQLHTIPSVLPLDGPLTSGFGLRRSPVTGRKEFHEGLDIAAPMGTRVRCPSPGIIRKIGHDRFMGNYIEIDHGYEIITRYGHLSKILKKKGDRLIQGETMALVGQTGRATGPHLHYELHINDTPKDPRLFILTGEDAPSGPHPPLLEVRRQDATALSS